MTTQIEPTKKLSEKEKNFLEEEIEIEFYNTEEPGTMHTFSYGPANSVKTYKLFHGGRYRLPRKVINHIESKGTTNWALRPDGRGSTGKVKEGIKPRFQCRQIFI